MAKLRGIDIQAYWIRDLLHRGKRKEALKRLSEIMATGQAGAETIGLADYLASAKRGRQPFGATHLWYDIGIENDEMREAGTSYEERMSALGVKYMLAKTQIETAVAKFEAAMDAIRTDERWG